MDIEREVRKWRGARFREMVGLGFSDEQALTALDEAEPRARARFAWIGDRMAALEGAQQALTAAWDRQLDAHPDVDWDDPDAPAPPDPPEEAAFQAIHAEMWAVIEEDRWPRHLHFPGV